VAIAKHARHEGERGTLMSTPKVQPLLLPVLRVLADGAEHPAQEIRKRVAEELKLPDDYVKRINSKTGQSPYENHVAWVFVYLTMGKVITKNREGVYQIAERGKTILASGVNDLTINEARNA
jgi:restriction system protein